jgi:hypothetical protein
MYFVSLLAARSRSREIVSWGLGLVRVTNGFPREIDDDPTATLDLLVSTFSIAEMIE